MIDPLNKLNKEQLEAVKHVNGPAIILAGAGSGKTRVLVHKVMYLINEKGVNPANILMVTFSNKAAGEMRDRISLLQNQEMKRMSDVPTVSTFHSLCARILRKSGVAIGIPHNFVIYDTNDQLDTIKDCLEKLEFSVKDIRPRAALEAISSAKNQMIDEKQYEKYARGYIQERVAKIYPLYQQLLSERNALDFDDLLNKTLKLFRDSPKTLGYYQDLFQYILIDEYQDTNLSQYKLTNCLSEKNNNICIVGDFSQSIYSFRGADYKNLEKFKSDYPTAKIFKLSQNYRSTQIILDAAYSIISNNSSHPVLNLWTDNKEGDEISIFEAENEHREAEYIVQTLINRKSLDPGFDLSSVAVLYRMNAQSRTLEEVFLHHSIPYKLVGGVRFYDRKEVKDVLSYISYLSNQQDEVSLKRIQKLGKRRFEEFEFYRREFNESNYIDNKETIEIIDDVLKKSKYLERYDPEDTEDRSRLENIKELRSVAIEFPNVIDFLENVALVEQDYLPNGKKALENEHAVTLMTMHAAKGLEFSMVFIVGLEEGVFPHAQSLFDYSDIEEERRLCYVGVTRAKKNLYLTYAKQRIIFGQRNTATPSRFIYELPEEVLNSNNIDISLLNKDFW